MQTKWLTLPTDDGPMEAYLATPDGGGPYPAVIVFMEAFGVNSYVRSVVDRLADAGYVALAPELFHRSGNHVEVAYDDMATMRAEMAKLTNLHIASDARTAAHALRARSEVNPAKLGVIGFCVGGFVALEAALAVDVQAAVAFYPGGVVHERPGLKLKPFADRLVNLKVPTSIQLGGDDQSIPAADREVIAAALHKSAVKHEIDVHPGAKHGFHSDDRHDAFNPHAAEAAWHKALAWFDKLLGGAPSAV